jgi:hypothetical protein
VTVCVLELGLAELELLGIGRELEGDDGRSPCGDDEDFAATMLSPAKTATIVPMRVRFMFLASCKWTENLVAHHPRRVCRNRTTYRSSRTRR